MHECRRAGHTAAGSKLGRQTASWLISCMLASGAAAGPAVQGISGTLNHGATVTISGSGFGTKARAAPVVWDNASGTDILSLWDGAWPNTNPTWDLLYRSPQRGISLPHNHITKYIAGAHGEASLNGADVVMFKTRTISSFPAYTYVSWYQRCDDAWVFGGDDNFKTYAYSVGTGPYVMPNNWYVEYNARPTSTTSTPAWHINDDGSSLIDPDVNGHSHWWLPAVNPMGGTWSKIEQEIKYTNQKDGFIRLYENGVLKVNYVGPTDQYPGTQRTEGIGGYAREYGQPNNWRYFADVYLDYTLQRVVLADSPDITKAQTIEAQVPTAWADGAVTVTVNLGRFATGNAAYVFVFDANGTHNASGFPVTAGGGTTALVPKAPTLTVQ